MDINHKLGKDRAEELEDFFTIICGDRPEVLDIVRNTQMHRFFTKNPKYWYGKKPTYSPEKNKILHQITLDQYLFEEVIDQEEYDNLKAMLDSPDMENATMVEMLFEVKHRPLWQKKRVILKRKLKKILNG